MTTTQTVQTAEEFIEELRHNPGKDYMPNIRRAINNLHDVSVRLQKAIDETRDDLDRIEKAAKKGWLENSIDQSGIRYDPAERAHKIGMAALHQNQAIREMHIAHDNEAPVRRHSITELIEYVIANSGDFYFWV